MCPLCILGCFQLPTCPHHNPYMHPLCALHALLMCLMHTTYVPYAHHLCTLCAPLMHTPYMPYAHSLCALCTPLMCLIRPIYAPFMYPLHALTQLLHTPYVPYVPLHALYTLHEPLQHSDWLMSPLQIIGIEQPY